MAAFQDWAEIVNAVVQDAAKASDESARFTLESNRAYWEATRHSCQAVGGTFGKTVMVSIDEGAQWACQLLADDLVRRDGERIAQALFRTD